MENYKLLGKAGKGAHGLVFKAMYYQTGKIVALKQITISNLNNGIPKSTMREICALRALHSIHIVDFLDIFSVGSSVVLVLEYLQKSLAELLKDTENPLSFPQIKTYSKMILSGVSAMHCLRIMHRDLKPANLLINSEGILKIADFGLSRIYNERVKDRAYTHQVGTRWYRAPELLYGSQKYTPAVDMWAVGCIIAEMIDKQPLFPGETDIAQLAIVIATIGTPTEEDWPGLTTLPDFNKISFTETAGHPWEEKFPEWDEWSVDLVRKILLYDANKRIKAIEALNHAFFYKKPFPCSLDKMPHPSTPTKDESDHRLLKDFDYVVKI